MDYRIELYDDAGRRRALIEETPLLDLIVGDPAAGSRVAGLLPVDGVIPEPGWTLRAWLDDRLILHCRLSAVRPEWGDTRKLILDQYVSFSEILAIEGSGPVESLNPRVVRAFTNRAVSSIVRDLIQSAPGPAHYTVAHSAWPEGAQREFTKFDARKTDDNELGVGAIETGQWVGADRIDATAAYAKDGDTIAGLSVDGAPWPDLRLMMIDAEERSRNSHAIKRHPELADWTEADYAASGYKRKAEAATEFLQTLINDHGIDYIELNPHRDATGSYDDRVDAYGRYLGLVYGGSRCFNAGLVEQHLADVYLYDGGRYLCPDLALKDFYSYAGPHSDSIESASAVLTELDIKSGLLEALCALAYAAHGFVFSVGPGNAIQFKRAESIDHVIEFDSTAMSLQLAKENSGLCNYLRLQGNPVTFPDGLTRARGESIAAFGSRSRQLDYFGLSHALDADQLAAGLLDDLAYPESAWEWCFFDGRADLKQGDCIELRGDFPLPYTLAEQWGGRFPNRLVGRVQQIQHRLMGGRVETRCRLTSPLRSVASPLGFMTRSQESAANFFQFRLDDTTVGLDMGFYLG